MVSIRLFVLAAMAISLTSVMSGEAAAHTAGIEPTCYGPVAPEPCCYEPCISYKNHRLLSRKVCQCSCAPPVEMILEVTDPRCCQYVHVPVCVPACCEGVPEVSSRCGILNRGVVEYTWCCGYRIKIVFAGHDKVNVHYYGL